MGDIVLLALVAAANPALLAAVTLMLFLPSPKRLLLGYLAGGMLVSLSIGFVIVFVVHDSGATSAGRNTVSPSIDIVLGLILLLVAYVLNAGHDQRVKERRQQKKTAKAGGVEAAERAPRKSSSCSGGGRPGSPSRSASSSPFQGSPTSRRCTTCRPSATRRSGRSW